MHTIDIRKHQNNWPPPGLWIDDVHIHKLDTAKPQIIELVIDGTWIIIDLSPEAVSSETVSIKFRE